MGDSDNYRSQVLNLKKTFEKIIQDAQRTLMQQMKKTIGITI